MTIAITGATGQLGRLVIQHLKTRVAPDRLRALARTPAKAADLGIAVRAADYDRPASLAPALAGVDALLLISSSEVGRRAAQHRHAIEAARAGEHGRGFAIVARNVQELAAETKTASESITTKVTEISSSVQEAMDDIRRVTGMFDVIRTSLASFTEFLATNKGFMERMEAAMSEAGGTIRRSSDEMEDSVRVMGEASVQFESMAATISAIVLAQKNLKSIRL